MKIKGYVASIKSGGKYPFVAVRLMQGEEYGWYIFKNNMWQWVDKHSYVEIERIED